MTQEEIEKQAEKYCKKECGSYYYECYRECSSVEAYKAGAKWGMEHAIEWHDLREDPEDLPKESGFYWCRTNYDDKFWKHRPCLFTKTDGIFDIDVIAWCELPQFKG